MPVTCFTKGCIQKTRRPALPEMSEEVRQNKLTEARKKLREFPQQRGIGVLVEAKKKQRLKMTGALRQPLLMVVTCLRMYLTIMPLPQHCLLMTPCHLAVSFSPVLFHQLRTMVLQMVLLSCRKAHSHLPRACISFPSSSLAHL